MATAIDVLAVMDEAALSQAIGSDRADMREARAAVAELIEAAEAVAGEHLTDVEIYDAQPRLRAALAKVSP